MNALMKNKELCAGCLIVVVALVVLNWNDIVGFLGLNKNSCDNFENPPVKNATNVVPEVKKEKVEKPITSKDLLPKSSDESASLWAKVNPVGEPKLKNKNFLVGVDTQGSSLRNANLQLRADPPNPRTNVSPWMNSTIDQDQTRKALC